jgi:hypothetical protein
LIKLDPKNGKHFEAIEKAMYVVNLDDDETVDSLQVGNIRITIDICYDFLNNLFNFEDYRSRVYEEPKEPLLGQVLSAGGLQERKHWIECRGLMKK